MISKSLSCSQRFASLHSLVPELAEFAQSLYPLLVSHADDWGRQAGDLFTVKHLVHPGSPRSSEDFDRALKALDQVGLIAWYEREGRQVIQITAFDEHQSGLHKRTKSKFPKFPGNSGKFREIPKSSHPTELNRTELNRTEGKRTELVRQDRAPTHSLLRQFDELHQAKVNTKARLTPGKDAKLLADLWRTHGELVPELMTLFFAQNGNFVRGAGYTVGVFASQFGRLLTLRAELQGDIGPRSDERQSRGAQAVDVFDRASEAIERVYDRRENRAQPKSERPEALGDPETGKT